MINKTFFFFLAFYSISISLVALDLMILYPLGLEMVSDDDTILRPLIGDLFGAEQLNVFTDNVSNINYDGESPDGNPFSKYFDWGTTAMYIVFETVMLLFEPRIFYLMFLLGINKFFVIMFMVIYYVFLARTIIGLVTGR